MRLLFWRKPKYRIELFENDRGRPHWRLVSAVNGQVLAHSEEYSDVTKRDQTAFSVARDAGWPAERKA